MAKQKRAEVDTSWLEGLEEAARERLPASVHRYFRQGSRAGVTFVSTASTLLGTPVSAPIAVAPSTLQAAAHPD